jgi:hypothetical protein
MPRKGEGSGESQKNKGEQEKQELQAYLDKLVVAETEAKDRQSWSLRVRIDKCMAGLRVAIQSIESFGSLPMGVSLEKYVKDAENLLKENSVDKELKDKKFKNP